MTAAGTPETGCFALIAGGGTAGHVHPAIAIARALVDRGHPPATIQFVGSERGIEATPRARRRASPSRCCRAGASSASSACRTSGPCGAWCGRWAGPGASCGTRRPRVVVSVGGYASVPCALAAAVRRIPIVVAEQNAAPGAANRLCRPLRQGLRRVVPRHRRCPGPSSPATRCGPRSWPSTGPATPGPPAPSSTSSRAGGWCWSSAGRSAPCGSTGPRSRPPACGPARSDLHVRHVIGRRDWAEITAGGPPVPPGAPLALRGPSSTTTTCRPRWPPPTWSCAGRGPSSGFELPGRRPAVGPGAVAVRHRRPPDGQRPAPGAGRRRRRRARRRARRRPPGGRGRRPAGRPGPAGGDGRGRARGLPAPTPPTPSPPWPRSTPVPERRGRDHGPRPALDLPRRPHAARGQRRRGGHERRGHPAGRDGPHGPGPRPGGDHAVRRAAAGAGGRGRHRPRPPPAAGGGRGGRHLHRHPGRRPRGRGGPGRRHARCCTGRRRWPPSAPSGATLAVAGTHGKTTTSAMLATSSRRPAASRAWSSAAASPASAAARRGAATGRWWSRPTRATARSSRWRRRRHRHQRRGRPPRALGRLRRRCGPPSSASWPPSPGRPCCALDDPGAAGLVAAAADPVTYGRAEGADYRIVDIGRGRPACASRSRRYGTGHGTGAQPRDAGESVVVTVPLRPASTTPATPPPPWRWPTGWASPSPRAPRRSARFARRGPPVRAARRGRRRHVRRRLRPPAHRGGRGPGRGRRPARGAGWCACSSPTATAAPRRCGATSPTPSSTPTVLAVTDVYPAGEAPRPGVTGKLLVDAVLDAHPWRRGGLPPAARRRARRGCGPRCGRATCA